MASLQNQTISTSYGQLLKTVNAGGIDGTLQAIEDGDGTTTALELSSSGVRSTGTLNAAGATTLSSMLLWPWYWPKFLTCRWAIPHC